MSSPLIHAVSGDRQSKWIPPDEIFILQKKSLKKEGYKMFEKHFYSKTQASVVGIDNCSFTKKFLY
jgi:hypothetical protein